MHRIEFAALRSALIPREGRALWIKVNQRWAKALPLRKGCQVDGNRCFARPALLRKKRQYFHSSSLYNHRTSCIVLPAGTGASKVLSIFPVSLPSQATSLLASWKGCSTGTVDLADFVTEFGNYPI